MPHPPRILVVDDDPIVADSLRDFLVDEGHQVVTASDGNEALAVLDQANRSLEGAGPADQPTAIGLVLTDMNMPRAGGLDLLRNVRKHHPSVAVIVITGFGKIEAAVESIKLGASDYLTKPIIDDELRIAVNKALRHHALLAENQHLRSQLDQRFGLANLVGGDYRMQKVYDLVQAVAPSRTTVLIDGESGTGKSMVAHAVHALSDRRTGPFSTFSCGAIPETLLESELFGHTKGAFTGADTDKPGKILAADGGTLFIDEINSATAALQLKLLRVLQEKKFEPLGATRTRTVDVRFVLATNQNLRHLVSEGAFREDLYYRINVVNISLPPLRDRLGDIDMLTAHFIQKYAQETGKTVTGVSDEAAAALRRYPWPGNVRELENAIERAVVLGRRPVISLEDLPDTVRGEEAGLSPGGRRTDSSGQGGDLGRLIPALAHGWTPTPLVDALEPPERAILHAALTANGWNRQETARQLDINRTTLYKKMKRFGLDQAE